MLCYGANDLTKHHYHQHNHIRHIFSAVSPIQRLPGCRCPLRYGTIGPMPCQRPHFPSPSAAPPLAGLAGNPKTGLQKDLFLPHEKDGSGCSQPGASEEGETERGEGDFRPAGVGNSAWPPTHPVAGTRRMTYSSGFFSSSYQARGDHRGLLRGAQ